jgi:hypothetical protein
MCSAVTGQAKPGRILGCRATRSEPEKRPFIGAPSVTWTKPDHALVRRGVNPSWCAILVRGSRASLSKRGLRARGLTTWSFHQPRRSPCQHSSSPWTPGRRDGGRARSGLDAGAGSLAPIAGVEGHHVATGELAEHPIPGQRRLPRSEEVGIRQSALVVAAIELVGKIGDARLAVWAVIGRARVPRKTLYDVFHQCEVCARPSRLNHLSKS